MKMVSTVPNSALRLHVCHGDATGYFKLREIQRHLSVELLA